MLIKNLEDKNKIKTELEKLKLIIKSNNWNIS